MTGLQPPLPLSVGQPLSGAVCKVPVSGQTGHGPALVGTPGGSAQED